MMRRHLSQRVLAAPAWRARPMRYARPSLPLVHRRKIHERGKGSLLPCEDWNMTTGQEIDQWYEMDVFGECGPTFDWGRYYRRHDEWNRNPDSDPIDTLGDFMVTVVILLVVDSVLLRFTDGHYTSILPARPSPCKITNSTPVLPDVGKYEGEEGIRVESPGVILSLKEACLKLRRQTETFAFPGKDDDSQGRIDIVRLASNEPVEDEWYAGQGEGPGGGRAIYAGVFDGHAGWATSRVLKKALVPYVSTALSHIDVNSEEDVVKSTIKKAFTSLDERILGTAQAAIASSTPASAEALNAMLPAIAGSCALLTIYDPVDQILRTAVAGDSRAVLGSWSEGTQTYISKALSKDQTGFNQREVDRLSEAHPGEKQDMLDPKSGRLFGMAITRAFGDHRWKYPLDVLEHMMEKFFDSGPRPKYKTPPYMTAEPEIHTRQVTTKDFAILASDGLWDHMSNEDAVTCVSNWLQARRAFTADSGPEANVDNRAVELNEYSSWSAKPENFVYEDLDSAAVCLVKNAFGGNRRDLFRAVMSQTGPRSRYVRDDVTVQVVFFEDPYLNRDLDSDRMKAWKAKNDVGWRLWWI